MTNGLEKRISCIKQARIVDIALQLSGSLYSMVRKVSEKAEYFSRKMPFYMSCCTRQRNHWENIMVWWSGELTLSREEDSWKKKSCQPQLMRIVRFTQTSFIPITNHLLLDNKSIYTIYIMRKWKQIYNQKARKEDYWQRRL